MSNLIKTILSKCPPEVPDFICIKSTDVFFPYMEIGVDCLVRDISELSLVFEVILSLTEINVCSINDICSILGLSFDIVKEVVVDLVSLDYVTASEASIRITDKGMHALKSKKSIQIKKYNLNNVAIDLITGKIFDIDSITFESVSKQSICFQGNVYVDLAYLERNMQDIKLLFDAQQKAINEQYRKSTKELYRMISIHHQKLKYIKKKLYIYKSINSEDLQFYLDNEPEGAYHDAMYEQLKGQLAPSLERFFESDREFKKKAGNFSFDSEKYSKMIELKGVLSSQLESILVLDTDFFCGKRYSFFDNEYLYYFENDKEINYKQLIIYSNRINSILNRSIYEEIKRISENKSVYIIYDKNEYNAKGSIEFFIPNDKRKNIHIIESSDISQSIICFSDSLMIDLEEYALSTLNGIISIKIPTISFDSKEVSNMISKLKEKTDIKKYLSHDNEHSTTKPDKVNYRQYYKKKKGRR